MPTHSFGQCRPSDDTILYEIFSQFYALLYSVPTSILYIIAIISIKEQASHYSPVYVRLITLSMSLNLTCWWIDFFLLQILGFSPFCPFWMSLSGEYLISLPYYVLSLFPLASLLCSTTISFYQMCVILFPLRAEQHFLRHISKIYFIIVVIPMVCCCNIFISRIRMMFFSSTSRMYLRLSHIYEGLDFITSAFVNGIIGIVCFIIISTTSLISIIRYSQIRAKNNNPVKLRLFIINLYICLSMISYITLQVFMFYARVFAVDFFLVNRVFSYRSLVSDVCYLPIPWVSLLINRRMRSYFLGLFGRKSTPFLSTAQSTSGNNKF